MIFYDSKQPGPNPTTVRLFALERGGLSFDVETLDMRLLENRRAPYRTTVNARGEMPALRLDNGQVITEITAICGYFDEIAIGGRRLCGATAEDRAAIHMWTRRMYLEIVLPFVSWWRGTPVAEIAYRGHRLLQPEAVRSNRLMAEQGFNRLDGELSAEFIAGPEITMADIILYAFMATTMHGEETAWMNVPQRPAVAAWFERMGSRPTARQMLEPLPAHFRN
jgi:glutathione S-transferase